MNAVGLVLALLLFPIAAMAEDLHELWDRQCGGCHGHAGAFARAQLDVVDGEVRDKIGRDVSAFLQRHNGGYSPAQIAAILGMLRAQASSTDLFQRKCAECHGTAAQMVRGQLVNMDGVLTVRASGEPVERLLRRHGRLNDTEAETLGRVLERIDGEVRHR